MDKATIKEIVHSAEKEACAQAMQYLREAGSEVCLSHHGLSMIQKSEIVLDGPHATESTHPMGRVFLRDLKELEKTARNYQDDVLYRFDRAMRHVSYVYMANLAGTLAWRLCKQARVEKVPTLREGRRVLPVGPDDKADVLLVKVDQDEVDQGKRFGDLSNYVYVSFSALDSGRDRAQFSVRSHDLKKESLDVLTVFTADVAKDGLFFHSTEMDKIVETVTRAVTPLFPKRKRLAARNG